MVTVKFCRPTYTTGSPCDIIEAYPGSLATRLDYQEHPVRESPTNVFGYVIGRTPRRLLGTGIGNPVRGVLVVENHNQIVVERLFPLREEAITHSEANRWAKINLNAYLKIGEITVTDNDVMLLDEPGIKLYTLTNEALEAVNCELAAYAKKDRYLAERRSYRADS